jgi:hypothetical protein
LKKISLEQYCNQLIIIDMTVENIAQVAHEMNKAYCLSLGDDSQLPWEDAPEWQKQSAIRGVQFHLANLDASPSASHDSWLAEKKADGWKYGEVKNPELKEHPSFRPYEELALSERSKDYIFKQVVHSLSRFMKSESVIIPTELTPGQKAVGLNFNPSGDDAVAQAKQKFADIIDQMDELRNTSTSPGVKRHASVAITDAETAQMRAVKALTWKD